MLHIPDSFETKRLLIRSPLPEDYKVMNEAVLESLDDLAQWLPWAKTAPTLEDSEKTCRRMRAKYITQEDLALFLFLKEDNSFVGGIGLHRIDWSVPKFEIGYWCRKGYSGKGYITEAAEGVTKFAFEALGARRVEIRMDELNLRSKAVPERLGFRLEARLVNDSLNMGGKLRTNLVYAKTL
jgi:RimJ/RimL family protein N-acetyltransferase